MAKKMKSHSGAKKRFSKTASGKIKFKKAGNNHLLTNKGKNHKSYPYGKVLSKIHKKTIDTLIPYK